MLAYYALKLYLPLKSNLHSYTLLTPLPTIHTSFLKLHTNTPAYVDVLLLYTYSYLLL